MSQAFYERPILNSPYEYPGRHWKLDARGQPTDEIVASRRTAEFISPVPATKAQSGKSTQLRLALGEKALSTAEQQYNPYQVINRIRREVDRWRELPEAEWGVTPETARLLRHWRHHAFQNLRPFFCQVEAAETAIWLVEVAGALRESGDGLKRSHREIWNHLHNANASANPELLRIALKMATGAGKTTVMAMLIAWQTVNAVRYPQRRNFTRGFLLVTPGITIRDRLRVLLPEDPESYYRTRELVPHGMLGDVKRAAVVITNFHAFQQRERLRLAKGTRALLRGRGETPPSTETEGQMLQRVMAPLLGMKSVLVLNDEGHHCYRANVLSQEREVEREEKEEAKRNEEAARVWISGIETLRRKLPVPVVFDLSATPFFLRGSGYAEGTLFPWTVSDFSLMDAIESGIVKLPRVPVSDNVSGAEMPKLRVLWEHIGTQMPKKVRGQTAAPFDPGFFPPLLETAASALYTHYERTFRQWAEAGIKEPPVFIVVCNNTATSKLLYDYLGGYQAPLDGHAIPLPITRGARKGQSVDFAAPAAAVTLPSGDAVPANGLLEWEVPREPPDDWPLEARSALERFWDARITRQRAMDESIARKADYETLYDKPVEDSSRVRVAGPFTVESDTPHRTLAVDEAGGLIPRAAEPRAPYGAEPAGSGQPGGFTEMVLENLRAAGVQQPRKRDRIEFSSIEPWAGTYIAAQGRYLQGERERRAAIFIGPEFGTVSRADLATAAREAAEAGFHVLVACAFAYDAQAGDLANLGSLQILKARMNADLHMGGELKKTGKGNLFVIFGEPDIDIEPAGDDGLRVRLNGVDVFHPQTGAVRSDSADNIPCWFIDTAYDGESFFVRHAYFPGAATDPYKALKTTLKAEIDREAWESLRRDVSRPFPKPASGRIAVKVINHLGDEVMKVFRV